MAASYAAFILGATGYVDVAVKDLEKVQQKHGKEVDDIVHGLFTLSLSRQSVVKT